MIRRAVKHQPSVVKPVSVVLELGTRPVDHKPLTLDAVLCRFCPDSCWFPFISVQYKNILAETCLCYVIHHYEQQV